MVKERTLFVDGVCVCCIVSLNFMCVCMCVFFVCVFFYESVMTTTKIAPCGMIKDFLFCEEAV